MKPRSLVLLGDSILDNLPYTRPEPDTASHLSGLLGPAWTVRLLAQDGATMSGLQRQLAQLDGAVDCAVLSIGGNDAIAHMGLLQRPSRHTGEALEELLAVADAFGREYETAAAAVALWAERTILCTIYEVRLDPPVFARRARVPLAVLNDRIIGTGARLGLDVLELRSVCTEAADFVRQIEPSGKGAAGIAGAIAGVVQGGTSLTAARVYVAAVSP
jgi:lysophospholipase L1-like esterase